MRRGDAAAPAARTVPSSPRRSRALRRPAGPALQIPCACTPRLGAVYAEFFAAQTVGGREGDRLSVRFIPGPFPGRGAARRRCTADPGSMLKPRFVSAVQPMGPGSAAHRFALRRVRDTRALFLPGAGADIAGDLPAAAVLLVAELVGAERA